MALVRWLTVLCLLEASVACAQQKDASARVSYAEGREAYQAGKYTVALEKFRQSYTLSGEPALLYNIATALQALNRPGDAAEALEQYLRARPDDPQRADLEKRIASLRLAQSLTDSQRQHEAQQRALEASGARPAAGWMSDAEADQLIHKEHQRRKKLAIGLGVGLGALAVGGIVVGVVCGLGHCTPYSDPKDYDYAKNPVTQ